jgi:NADH-quinone oxidoreductase subunit N
MSGTANFQLQDIVCISPALFLFLGSLFPITFKIFNNNKEPNPIVALALAMLGILGALTMSFVLIGSTSKPYYAFSSALVFDGVSTFTSVIVCLVVGVAAIMSRENRATNGAQFSEYLFLLLNSAMGMLLFAWSNDLIVTFISIEVMSLCLYLLIALSHEEQLSKEAAFKYFVLGSFASAIFLYGVAFIYGVTGTTYMNDIVAMAPQLMAENQLFLVAVILVLVGFSFKAAIAPFHAWAPDVYQGAPTPVTAYMATAVKLVTFVAFLRFLRGDYISYGAQEILPVILQWLAVATMLVGNIAAVIQKNLKRMLAYSSVAHSGYIMMGLLAAAVGGEAWRGDVSVLYYAAAYVVMTLGAFGVISILENSENDVVMLDDLRGLAKRNPGTAAMFTIFLLSLAGIPPTVGFFGKFFIFSAAIKQGFFWLAVWAAINAVISAYYYLRPIVNMYMQDADGVSVANHYKLTRGLLVILAVLVVVLGLTTQPFYKEVLKAINTLL